MNVQEITMAAARTEFVQIHKGHLTAIVPVGLEGMVEIVQV